MIYVALLRGINVGGKNKVEMKQLKCVFEQVGMAQVSTYINSGNVVFKSDILSVESLSEILEQAIVKHFALSIKVLLRNIEQLEQLMMKLPDSWQNNKQMKSDVLFCWEDVSPADLKEQLTIKPAIDDVIFLNQDVLWHVEREQVTRSGMMRLAGQSIYQKMTVRNVNTTRKIYQLMQQIK
ncbi:Uncharacterized conserved protein, DUF1697 family [Amphibacillus marinus]|uniref:Uncharacterized conserved protein, DUF1697 family n=1 Tax=Amphibacillus marinus TaxID=872970 RepID=A0A1H8LST8_9BACI|nr:DUF1697 domain-containing protein [Amphibacillus marinus]SEO07906.1 Uncharacterized conserved protein, DUF1697 family [Amphibacillus marinus]